MREIKFRMFYRYADDEQKMIYMPEFYSGVGQVGWSDCHYVDLGADDHDAIGLMQYTGLKDKNGVEIYEGDVVVTGPGTTGRVWEVYYGIEHDYPAFELKGWDGECNGLQYFTVDTDEWGIEVIGNIYENPELLNPVPGSPTPAQDAPDATT